MVQWGGPEHAGALLVVGSWWWPEPAPWDATCAAYAPVLPSKSSARHSMQTMRVTTSASASSSWVTTIIEVPSLDEPAQHLCESHLARVVDPRRGLVHDQHVRPSGERTCDEDPALLPPEREATSSCARSARPTSAIDSRTIARSSRLAGRHQGRWGSRPTSTISVTVARTDVESECRCGT